MPRCLFCNEFYFFLSLQQFGSLIYSHTPRKKGFIIISHQKMGENEDMPFDSHLGQQETSKKMVLLYFSPWMIFSSHVTEFSTQTQVKPCRDESRGDTPCYCRMS